MSQSGLWAITVPKQYGGAEVSSHTVAKVIALLSGADGSIGQIPQNHFYALEVLRNTGTETQKQRLYGEVLMAPALVMHLLSLKLKLQPINKLTFVRMKMDISFRVKSFTAQEVYLLTVFQP